MDSTENTQVAHEDVMVIPSARHKLRMREALILHAATPFPFFDYSPYFDASALQNSFLGVMGLPKFC